MGIESIALAGGKMVAEGVVFEWESVELDMRTNSRVPLLERSEGNPLLANRKVVSKGIVCDSVSIEV
jgi:hypothetical protein